MPMRNRVLPGCHISDWQLRRNMSLRQTLTASVPETKAGVQRGYRLSH
jgi:hypothetical protein